jgi:citronellol/citronellal dehydrogenase
MSICALGMAREFRADGLAVNCLWPRTTIDTAAVRNLLGGEAITSHSRKPEIVADAAYWIFTQPSRECTGNFFIDDLIIEDNNIADLESYSVTPGAQLVEDFFVPGDTRLPKGGLTLSSLH